MATPASAVSDVGEPQVEEPPQDEAVVAAQPEGPEAGAAATAESSGASNQSALAAAASGDASSAPAPAPTTTPDSAAVPPPASPATRAAPGPPRPQFAGSPAYMAPPSLSPSPSPAFSYNVLPRAPPAPQVGGGAASLQPGSSPARTAAPVPAAALQPPAPGQFFGNRPSFSYNVVSHANARLPTGQQFQPDAGTNHVGQASRFVPPGSLQPPAPGQLTRPGTTLQGAMAPSPGSIQLPFSVPRPSNIPFGASTQQVNLDTNTSKSDAPSASMVSPHTMQLPTGLPSNSPSTITSASGSSSIPIQMPTQSLPPRPEIFGRARLSVPGQPSPIFSNPTILPGRPTVPSAASLPQTAPSSIANPGVILQNSQPPFYPSYPGHGIVPPQPLWGHPHPPQPTGAQQPPFQSYPGPVGSLGKPMVGASAATMAFANAQPSGVSTGGDRKEQTSTNPGSEQPTLASAEADSTGHGGQVNEQLEEKRNTGVQDSEAWSAHKTETGVVYYYNALTGESTYQRPPGYKGEPEKVATQPVPVSWDKLAGTDWSIVSTSDGKKYYYDNKQKVGADESGGKSIFPTNRPSIILFIDRLSHSSKVRDESKFVIKLLRQYVQNNYPFHVSTRVLSSGTSKTSSEVVDSLRNTGISDSHSESGRLSAWASKLMALGDKMSVMVVNDGDNILYRTSSHDSGSNPLYDVLTKLLHKTRPGHRLKKTRINLVTKDVGPNMLSDDSKIQVVDSLSAQESEYKRVHNSVATSDNSNDDIAEVSVDENTAEETEYIDDGQAPSILEKTPATYPYENDNDNDLESDVAEVEDQSKSEASDMSPDLQEDVSFNAYSSGEVEGILHKCIVEKTVTETFESDERNMHADQEESVSSNEQDDGSSVLDKKFRKNENVIYEENTCNLHEGSEESDTRCPHHATCSSSCSPVKDDTDFTEHVTSSISDDRFAGSFYFSDGGYRLLKTLTGGSRIPSLVIIDPVEQKHYVFPEEIEYSYASLQNYLDSFTNGSLPSYYHVTSLAISSKELPRPPFVNHDFHEANSIPQLTTNSFCPLVFGSAGCDSKSEVPFSNTENLSSGWNKDVMVLFSNSWCGFCQRAELVVRELHRSFKSFSSYSDSSSANAQDVQVHAEGKNEKYAMKGFPVIYMIDCTSNECHHLLKSAGMEELYPTLLLFPAENKSAIAYEGGMSVVHLINFLESHVSNSRHLLEYKGYMWKKRMATQQDAPQAFQFHISDKGSGSVGSDLPNHSDVVTGSILTATDKLGTAVPFDNSKVLIVSSDSHGGFHGLIINKRLSWGIFKNLDSSMESIKHAPLFYGGPVVVQGYHLVSLSRVALEGYMQVIPGVYYGNIIATSRVVTWIKSGEQSVDDLWFFLGYSGWGYNQLLDELSEGAWLVSGKPIEHLDWPET